MSEEDKTRYEQEREDYNNKLYMIPESYKANKLQLFRCLKFPYKWELARILKNIESKNNEFNPRSHG